jgi:hypothetical protein
MEPKDEVRAATRVVLTAGACKRAEARIELGRFELGIAAEVKKCWKPGRTSSRGSL